MQQYRSPAYDIVGKVLVSFFLCSEQVMLVQALLSASGILLEELQKLSQSINQPIDMKDIASNELFGFTPRSDLEIANAEVSGQVSSKIHNVSEVL